MDTKKVRVRFAPSPTGFMHLGNVRAALLNYLFAQQKNGAFILRIEDTDLTRNVDPDGKHIIQDLKWLNLKYQEGPIIGGPYDPYYQSKRNDIYKKYLEIFKEKNLIYRCFCSVEELEKKRQRQLALKMPPRYDRACAILPQSNVDKNIEQQIPSIWRFRLNYDVPVEFYDLAHKTMHFDLKHFSDVPLSRQDGSFTFMFANFVDDVEMGITHILRGEDHLTNTALQVAMYNSLGASLPIFWHLPIIGNQQGKKLSKRDFGFSLTDLKNNGFLPEAICNYLAIIGGSFENEVLPLEQLAQKMNFDAISTTGQIKYDLDQLKWINHHWIMNYDTNKLTELCYPFLQQTYPQVKDMDISALSSVIKHVQQELVTLADSVQALNFYFTRPAINNDLLEKLEEYHWAKYREFLNALINQIEPTHTAEATVALMQKICKDHKMPIKDIFTLLRIALTGKSQGPGIKDLIAMLGQEEAYKRLKALIS